MVTKEQVKQALGYENTTKYDSRINALIPEIELWIKGYCNITDIPEDYNLNIIRMIEFHLKGESGIQSKSISRVSYTYSQEYPDYCLKGLRRRLRW